MCRLGVLNCRLEHSVSDITHASSTPDQYMAVYASSVTAHSNVLYMLVALITIIAYLILWECYSAVCMGIQHSCPDLLLVVPRVYQYTMSGHNDP